MTSRRTPASLAVLVVLGLACASATALQPTTKPAKSKKKQPASAPAPTTRVGDDTPLDGLKAYQAAAQAGDRDAMLRRIITGSSYEAAVANASVDTDLVLAKLYKAATDKFGADAKTKIAEIFDDKGIDDVGKIDLRGDRALVHDKSGAPRFRMARQDGIWKQDMGGSLNGHQDSVPGIVHGAQQVQFIAKGGLEDLGKDKYKTLDELVAALEKNLSQQRRMDP